MNEEYKQRVLDLAQQIASGNDADAARLLDEITRMRESSLFQELGKLTREFHEALQAFRLDSRIASIAEKDFPDARERLKYVITMTAQSADRSLTAVEESMPVCTRLEQEAAELHGQWQRFLRREMDANEFRALSARVAVYLASVGEDTGKLKGSLNEITMAQDFQDLTGQIIKRVIGLVDDLEASLVDLVRISGQNLLPPQKKKEMEKDGGVGAYGPPVPGVDDVAELVSGQDGVDDLLSSLGF